MSNGKNLAIIGAGPGGYVAALKAALFKFNVTLIEKEEVGGTCLNVGCIPTKVLTSTAHFYSNLKQADKLGFDISEIKLNWGQVQKRKQSTVQRLVTGVKSLLKSRGVNLIYGTAQLVEDKKIEVKDKEGKTQTIDFDNLIIATGSIPIKLPIPGAELEGIIDSTGALSLSEVPKTMLVIGGGVIGCEFSSIYQSFGTEITIVEMLPQILPGEDEEIVSLLRRNLEKKGMKIYTNSKVSKITDELNNLKRVFISTPEGEIQTVVEKVLVCVGRKANLSNLNLEKLGITLDKGNIWVNEYLQTNFPNIYAIGDCIGNWQLAHVASMEGEIAVENILGEKIKMDYTAVPRCIFTNPEIGSVGLAEKEAQQKGFKIKVGKFPFMANGRALAENEYEGTVKIIAEEESGKILGAHILGNRATDLIAELTLAKRKGLTAQDIEETIHAHPTLPEAIRESALKLLGKPIHIS
jgi:dihydrolipoamide dehydrogenase